MDPALHEAVTGELRAFVRDAGRRRSLSTTCHVGLPGGERVSIPHDEAHPWTLSLGAPTGVLVGDAGCGTVDADAEWLQRPTGRVPG